MERNSSSKFSASSAEDMLVVRNLSIVDGFTHSLERKMFVDVEFHVDLCSEGKCIIHLRYIFIYDMIINCPQF